jgi:hypothetical protein
MISASLAPAKLLPRRKGERRRAAIPIMPETIHLLPGTANCLVIMPSAVGCEISRDFNPIFRGVIHTHPSSKPDQLVAFTYRL